MQLLLALLLGQTAGYAVADTYQPVVRLVATYAALALVPDVAQNPIILTAPLYPHLAYWMVANLSGSRDWRAEAAYAAGSVATACVFDRSMLPALGRIQAGDSNTVLLIATIYTASVFGGGRLVKWIPAPFMKHLSSDTKSLPQAGKIIGWAERFLVLTFVLIGQYELVGYLLVAKTAARFPTLQERRARDDYAEYYLIGTLSSVALAVSAGVLLKVLLWAL